MEANSAVGIRLIKKYEQSRIILILIFVILMRERRAKRPLFVYICFLITQPVIHKKQKFKASQIT